MNDVVDSAGRGRGWQRSPRTLVRSFVVPTHVPRSAMDTSVTAHCHAAPAQLTRAYQSDHRRNVLTPATTRRCPPTPSVHHPLTTPFHIRSAQRGTSAAAAGGGGRSAPSYPDSFWWREGPSEKPGFGWRGEPVQTATHQADRVWTSSIGWDLTGADGGFTQ